MKRTVSTLLLAAAAVIYAQPAENPSTAVKAAMLVEDAFAEVVENAKPAVVVITNKQIPNPAARQMDFMPDNFFDFFNIPREQYRNPGDNQKKRTPIPRGSGSGFIVNKNGYIVTNYHVIKDYDSLEVKTADGTVYDSAADGNQLTVIGYDEESDLAVLRIGNAKNDFPCLEFANSDNIRVGQWAIAIGAPYSLDYSVTIGCVSQKGRVDMGMSTFDSYIQTDASINPGNSGGPLLDIRGRVIGVNQFIVTGGGASRGSVGIGFAIASNISKKITEELIENGQIIRPFLGISMQELNKAIKEQTGIEYGVLVREILPGEAAEKAGLKPGDIIQTVAGKKVKTNHELLMEVTNFKPGDKIELGIRRGDENIKITVKPGRRDEYLGTTSKTPRSKAAPADTPAKKLGLELAFEKGKIIVTNVIEDGPADKASATNEDKIRKGDILLAVSRQQVNSLDDVDNALKGLKKKSVMLYLQRNLPGKNDYKFFFALKLAD